MEIWFRKLSDGFNNSTSSGHRRSVSVEMAAVTLPLPTRIDDVDGNNQLVLVDVRTYFMILQLQAKIGRFQVVWVQSILDGLRCSTPRDGFTAFVVQEADGAV